MKTTAFIGLALSAIASVAQGATIETRNDWPGWRLIGESNETTGIHCDGDKIYQHRFHTNRVLRYNWDSNKWSTVDSNKDLSYITAYAGALAKQHQNGEVYLHTSGRNWTKIDDANELTVYIYANADGVHKLTKEGVHVWNGVRWNRLDEYDRILSLGGRLLLSHTDESIWRWIGPGINWQQIDNSLETAGFVSDPDGGLTIKHDRKGKFYRYLGEPYKWSLMKGTEKAHSISIGQAGTWQLRWDDSSIWKYVPAGSGGEQWIQYDGNPNSRYIYARCKYPVQQHSDGKIWVYRP